MLFQILKDCKIEDPCDPSVFDNVELIEIQLPRLLFRLWLFFLQKLFQILDGVILEEIGNIALFEIRSRDNDSDRPRHAPEILLHRPGRLLPRLIVVLKDHHVRTFE